MKAFMEEVYFTGMCAFMEGIVEVSVTSWTKLLPREEVVSTFCLHGSRWNFPLPAVNVGASVHASKWDQGDRWASGGS